MKRHNKKTGDSLRFVLLNGLGSCANEEGDYLVTIPDNAYILDFVGRFLDALPGAPRGASSTRQARDGRRSPGIVRARETFGPQWGVGPIDTQPRPTMIWTNNPADRPQ
jgi:hypothetical protein